MDHAVTQTTSEAAKESPKSRKRGTSHPDRVWIGADALNRLSAWATEINGKLQGVTVSRSDLVNFIVTSHPETLSAAEMKEVEARYFDPIKHAQWARVELEAALARGEKVTLVDIVMNNRPSSTGTPRTRKTKSDVTKNSENPGKNAQKQSHTTSQDSPIFVDKSAGE